MSREDFDKAMTDAGITDEHWAAAERICSAGFRERHAAGFARLARIRLRFPGFGRRREVA